MREPLYPSLYQINTRVWLTELSQALGRPATMDDIPDAEMPFADLDGGQWRLQDQLEEVVYDRDGSDLQARGLYLDALPWQTSVFALARKS